MGNLLKVGIPKGSLEAITIPVPDIPTQRTIVKVADLAARETALLHQLAERRNLFTGRVLADLAHAGEGIACMLMCRD